MRFNNTITEMQIEWVDELKELKDLTLREQRMEQ